MNQNLMNALLLKLKSCRYRNAAMFYYALEGTYPYHTDALDWLVSGLSLRDTACHDQVFVKFLCPFNCISKVIFWRVLYCAAVEKPQISCFWVIYNNNRQKRDKTTHVTELPWLNSRIIQTQMTDKEGGHGDLLAVLRCWCLFNAVNKISTCEDAVISNLTVCHVCAFHAAVFRWNEIICWSTGISSINMWAMKSIVMSLFCGKLIRYLKL